MTTVPRVAGTAPRHHDHDHYPREDERWEFSLTLEERGQCVLAAAVFLGLGWLFEVGFGSPLLAELAFWLALGCGVWSFLEELLEQPLGVATLMAVASVGAAALPRGVHEGATLAVLFAISELVIHFTFARTRKGLRDLLDLVPKKVTVLQDGRERLVDPAELVAGDQMVIGPGERLATDGLVVSGSSLVDLSAVTGEPVPVEVYPASVVYAGGVNGLGALVVEATVTVTESSLGRLVRVLEEATENRGAAQGLVDRLATRLVPLALASGAALFLLGVVTGDLSRWSYRGLLVLVALSPCAFVIALPVTLLASVGAASRAGILIKGGAALETLARVRVAALDKTGTLTLCWPRVLQVVPVAGRDEREVLAVAGALERRSEHPLSGAILAVANAVPAADNVEAIPGSGLVGVVGGRPARLGRPGFVPAGPLSSEVERLQQSGATVVVVEHDNETLGVVAVRDELRPEASAAVTAMRAAGIERVVMLTGDNHVAAEALARLCGVDDVRAELLPEDKVVAVKELRQQAPVLMVGDGINDAPALACADVGIAMGALGADLAVEAADVAFMGDDLRHLPAVLLHARRTKRIVGQGLVLSAATIVLLVPLAVSGVFKLAPMVFFHELSGVLIILNGLRAGKPVSIELDQEAVQAVSTALVPPAPSAQQEPSSPRQPRTKLLAPRRLAVGLAAMAIGVGLGGAILHMRAGRANPYLRWSQEAGDVLDRVAGLAEDYGAAPKCPPQERIDRLERQLPKAPEAEMRKWAGEMFEAMRRQEIACHAGDRQAVGVAGNAVTEKISELTTWAVLKSDSDHEH